jgi:hypothetical protein
MKWMWRLSFALHDAVEDTYDPMKSNDLRPGIAGLVTGLTKISKIT